MDIGELRKRPHLSASSVIQYQDCGLAYRFSRVDKLKPEFRSSSMELGTTIHRVLARFYLERMTGNELVLPEINGLFDHYWSECADTSLNIRYKAGSSFESLRTDGKALLAAYFSDLPSDNYKVLAIEEPFSFKIPGVAEDIIGVWDLLEEDEAGTLVLTDFKTSSKTYSRAMVDKSPQMTLYQMGAKANGYRDREIVLKFDVLIKTKVAKVDRVYTTRSLDDELRLTRTIRAVSEGIQAGIWIPNDEGWKCGGCQYKTACNDNLRKEHKV